MEYYDLGSHGRPVITDPAEAQLWFDRGLVWTYAFHHEEAVACFEKAVAADRLMSTGQRQRGLHAEHG